MSVDLLAVLRVAARRWYILLPLLVLGTVGGWAVSQKVSPKYQIEAVLPISAPYTDSDDASNQLSRNPFNDIVTTSKILGLLGDSPDVRSAVEDGGGDPDYEITGEGGVLSLTVRTDSPDRTLATYGLISDALGIRLDALQADAGVPPAFRVTIRNVLRPAQAEESLGNRQRVLIASVALGGTLSIAICVFADYVLTRRRTGRIENSGSGGDDRDAGTREPAATDSATQLDGHRKLSSPTIGEGGSSSEADHRTVDADRDTGREQETVVADGETR